MLETFKRLAESKDEILAGIAASKDELDQLGSGAIDVVLAFAYLESSDDASLLIGKIFLNRAKTGKFAELMEHSGETLKGMLISSLE